jgi:glutaredoxin
MEQRCYLVNVWFSWLALALMAAAVWWRAGVIVAVLVIVVGVIAQYLYINWFPLVSRFVGYGSVADAPALRVPDTPVIGPVTFYTANLCPFCPIVRRRLADLQKRMNFELREVDVTLRADLIRAKGLRSVPVVECAGRMLAGNATSQQLAAFLSGTISPA